MKFTYLILALTFQALSYQANAEIIKDKIHSVETGRGDEDHLVYMDTGRVVFLENENTRVLNELESSKRKDEWLEIDVDEDSYFLSMKVVAKPEDSFNHDYATEMSNDPYQGSVVSLTTASNMFKRMRRDYTKKGQCFNRAHIWTYEEFMRSKTNLNKVFMFFTSRYIRKYNYHWWFHVTPMTYVGGTKYTNWKMLDRRYTSQPLRPKTWSDIFIKSKKSCKVVSLFSQYRNNQRTQDCYFIKASMYTVVPSDLVTIEEENIEKTEYDQMEIDHAMYDAFK